MHGKRNIFARLILAAQNTFFVYSLNATQNFIEYGSLIAANIRTKKNATLQNDIENIC